MGIENEIDGWNQANRYHAIGLVERAIDVNRRMNDFPFPKNVLIVGTNWGMYALFKGMSLIPSARFEALYTNEVPPILADIYVHFLESFYRELRLKGATAIVTADQNRFNNESAELGSEIIGGDVYKLIDPRLGHLIHLFYIGDRQGQSQDAPDLDEKRDMPHEDLELVPVQSSKGVGYHQS